MQRSEFDSSNAMATVIENREVGPGCFEMRLADRDVAANARPGQFVHVRVPSRSLDPLLRRPFSVCLADPSQGAFIVLYRVVGKMTQMLAGLRPGDALDVLGPLGRGFEPPPGAGSVALVAGGIGIAPLVMLGHALFRAGREFTLVIGVRSRDLLTGPGLLPRPERAGDPREASKVAAPGYRVEVATEDGSFGIRGLATDVLGSLLAESRFACVYACGPLAMLRGVARLGRARGVPVQVSLEERMACGLGACLGCAVKARARGGAGPEQPAYLRVCADGPVFWTSEVDLDDLP